MIKLKKDRKAGYGSHYLTKCEKFWVWKEPYSPYHWYVNEADGQGGWHDAQPPDGFPTLFDAKNYIGKEMGVTS